MDYSGRVDVDKILNSAWLEAKVRARTDQVAARARAYADVDSGRLRASITS